MSELISNLNTIESVKTDIKSAIEAKGVSMSGVSFPDYPAAIGSITTSFVTTTLSTSVNGTFTPGVGIDGYSQVVVDVPQSVTGFTEKQITERNYPNVLHVNNSASYVQGMAWANTDIVTVTLLSCLAVGKSYTTQYSAFWNCNKLTTVNLPICTYINADAFNGCKKLSDISIPLCQVISDRAFMWCYSLSTIVLPVCSTIGNYCFSECSNLKTITLGSTSVCKAGTKIFQYITGQISVYVPSSLVSAYQTSTNWSQYKSWIFPIPE